MPELDELAPNYHRAQQRWPEAPTLARCYEALNACFNGNAHGLVEHVKSFIESVCLTIMGEFRTPMPSSQPSTTELLVAALGPLGLKNTKGAAKLDKVLSGFNKLSDAIGEMRNEVGPVAHGKDGFLDAIAADHARAFLHVGDVILGILLNAFDGKQPDLVATREPYENFPHLNERIDRAVAVAARVDDEGDRPMVVFSVASGPLGEAIELRVEPSRLLYGIDREAYVEVLKTVQLAIAEAEEGEEPKMDSSAAQIIESPASVVGTRQAPATELVGHYQGELADLQNGVEAFLLAEGMNAALTHDDGARLIDSLLATAEENLGLDWKEREAMQAKLKVASKRVLVRFGCAAGKADDVAERFVAGLRVQAAPNTATVELAPLAFEQETTP